MHATPSLAAGRSEDAAEAEAFLAACSWFRGQHDAVFPHLHAAEELLAGAPRRPPSPGCSPGRRATDSSPIRPRRRSAAGPRRRSPWPRAGPHRHPSPRAHDDRLREGVPGRHAADARISSAPSRSDARLNSPMTAGATEQPHGVRRHDATCAYVVELGRQAQEAAERFGDATLHALSSWQCGRPPCGSSGSGTPPSRSADELVAESEHGSATHSRGTDPALPRLHAARARTSRGSGSGLQARPRTGPRGGARRPGSPRPRTDPQRWAALQLGRMAEARAAFERGDAASCETHPNSRPWVIAEVALALGDDATVREVLLAAPPSPGRAGDACSARRRLRRPP